MALLDTFSREHDDKSVDVGYLISNPHDFQGSRVEISKSPMVRPFARMIMPIKESNPGQLTSLWQNFLQAGNLVPVGSTKRLGLFMVARGRENKVCWAETVRGCAQYINALKPHLPHLGGLKNNPLRACESLAFSCYVRSKLCAHDVMKLLSQTDDD